MQVKKEDKRNRILDVAIELFSTKGFENVSVSEIAKKAGVGKGTVYVYFPSKVDILKEAFLRVYLDLEDFLEEASRGGDVERFARELGEYVVFKTRERMKLINAVHSSGIHYRELREKLMTKYDEILKRVHANLGSKLDFEEFYFRLSAVLMASFALSERFEERVGDFARRAVELLL